MKQTDSWRTIDWTRAEKRVRKLQRKIYQASRDGNLEKTHVYQDLLLKSQSAKLLAVRKVTQDNRGKKTPGVDNVRAIDQRQRLKTARLLKLDGKASPIRRVYIPKPGKAEKRPLGIPTLFDRTKQALAKLALEPQWEARFEPNSYGFRPGRSCHDAISAIHTNIATTPRGKYVLDADISKCFDTIDHDKLLEKLDVGPKLKRQISAWLKTGILHGETILESKRGTPQGGVISPLLSNIALHGLENHLKNWIVGQALRHEDGKTMGKPNKKSSLGVIRYADDFVILHRDREIILKAWEITASWLKQNAGLELSETKTRFVHTDKVIDKDVGFNFLGYHVRRYATGKYGSNKVGSGMKTLIKPSRTSISKHKDEIRRNLRKYNNAEALISTLTPIIRGWCNYFKVGVSSKIFSGLRKYTFLRLFRWARKKHPGRTADHIYQKYFVYVKNQREFAVWVKKEGQSTLIHLPGHDAYKIKRHVKVRDTKSPFDGDTGYWAQRLQAYGGLSKRAILLLRLQRGLCKGCGLHFGFDCVLEVDHIVPLSRGGKDELSNLQLLHVHCHDQKPTRVFSEEPYEGKPSCTVLN